MDGHEHLDLRALPGSERAPAPGVKKAGSALPGDAPVEATLILRRRAELSEATLGAILSRDELAVAYGADPADVDLVVLERQTRPGRHKDVPHTQPATLSRARRTAPVNGAA